MAAIAEGRGVVKTSKDERYDDGEDDECRHETQRRHAIIRGS